MFENLSNIEETIARFFFKMSGQRRRALWFKLATMLNNGVALIAAIDELRRRRTRTAGKRSPETVALGAWHASLSNGNRLSSAVNGWVSTEELMMITAGEKSGQLEDSLVATTKLMAAKGDITKAVMSGLTYPTFLIIMAFGVLYLFGIKYIPEISGFTRNPQWTGLAKTMVAMSAFTQSWLWVCVIGTIGAIAGFFVALGRFDGRIRVFLDRYPPFSIYRIMQGSSWLIATSALINAGLRNEAALEQLSASASPWLRNRLDACLRGMRSGINMGDALSKSGYEFPDREIIDDLGIYASFSSFNEALNRLGEEWMTESIKQIKSRMTVVFYVSLFIVGGLVATMISGVLEMQLQIGQMSQGTFY